MSNARWLSFGIRSALTDTVVHFFPVAENVRAPYPAICKFRLFGGGEATSLVTVEGARLSQPDGIRVGQLFKDIPDSGGLYGLEVILASQQSRVNLSSSRCIVEIASAASSARFRPRWSVAAKAGEDPEVWRPSPAVAVKDSYHTTSLVVVNMSADPIQVPPAGGSAGVVVQPGRVIEHNLGDGGSAALVPGVVSPEGCATSECSWGLMRTFPLRFPVELPGESAAFVLYRDSVTKTPHSIVAL
jgi:hypothetical protein